MVFDVIFSTEGVSLRLPYACLLFRIVWQISILSFILQKYSIFYLYFIGCRSQWPRRLRRRSVAERLLRSWVRISPGSWMFVCCEFCVLSGRGLCDELTTRPEESYRLWCVVVYDLETSRMRRPWPAFGRSATAKKIIEWHSVSCINQFFLLPCERDEWWS